MMSITLDQNNVTKAIELFDRLSAEVLSDANAHKETDGFSQTLWLLPMTTVNCLFEGIQSARQKETSELLLQLQRRAAAIIEKLPESVPIRSALSARLKNAATRLRFESWDSDDLETYVALLDNKEMWTYFPEEYPDPLTPEIAEALISNSNEAEDRHQVHAIHHGGDIVGQARLLFDGSDDAAEISYWIGQEYWGKGLASDVVALYTRDRFAINPHINRIYAKVTEGNAASVRVLEKAGYRHESVLYQDVVKEDASLDTAVLGVYRDTYHAI